MDSTTLDLTPNAPLSPVESTQPVLILSWSHEEPARLGECTFLNPGQAYSCGRGDSGPPHAQRCQWVQVRPGSPPTLKPGLGGKSLSRHHLDLHHHPEGISFKNVGKANVYINGQLQLEGILRPGDTLQIAQELLLLCEQRPVVAYPPVMAPPPFGHADSLGLIGESPTMWRLRDHLQLIAATRQSLLIRGESGTGKKLITRMLQKATSRTEKPFVYTHATSLTADFFAQFQLREDQPFLLIDGLEELSPSHLPALVRLLKRCDLSPSPLWLAATVPEDYVLPEELATRFVSTLQMPTLAMLKGDIPLLAPHFLRYMVQAHPHLAARFFTPASQPDTVPQPRISLKLMQGLLHHTYSDNLRELYSILWTSLSTSEPPYLDLTPQVKQRLQSPASYTQPTELTAAQIEAAMKASNQRVAAAAQLLGLKNRWTLYRLLDKYDIRY